MELLWQRIDGWLAANAPEVAKSLNPPATDEELAKTEEYLGVQFPPDVRRSLLIHNGQSYDGPGLINAWELLSLERIRSEWKVWKELLDGGDFEGITSDGDDVTVRSDWWNPRWIPLTYSGSGDHHCLDMDPGPKGAMGQIIEMWHDEGVRPIEASSFREWLMQFADGLEAGEYELSEDYGGLIRREDED